MLGTLLGTFEYDPFERRIYKQSPGAPDGELPPGDFSWGIFTEGNSGFRSPDGGPAVPGFRFVLRTGNSTASPKTGGGPAFDLALEVPHPWRSSRAGPLRRLFE